MFFVDVAFEKKRKRKKGEKEGKKKAGGWLSSLESCGGLCLERKKSIFIFNEMYGEMVHFLKIKKKRKKQGSKKKKN